MSILQGAGILWRSIYAVIIELSGGNGCLLFSIEGDEHQSMNDLSCLGTWGLFISDAQWIT